MAAKVHLKIAVAEAPHTAAVRNGSIAIEGVDAEILTIKPQIAAFRRMVRDVEFDVCEIASTTYLIARAFGAPFVALPIFLMRRFHHGGLLVRPDAGIAHPKDLEGKKVGVRAYSVTTGVWTRGILIDEYGLDSSKVTWVVDDEEHVTQLKLPPNVEHVAPGDTLYEMIERGDLAAGFGGNAGVGRTGDPKSGWKEVQVDYPDLFPNAEALEAEWFYRTGIYPIHGTIVVKDEILKAHPWVAKSLYDAFLQSKNEWLAGLAAREASGALQPGELKYAKLAKIVGDPMPYGIAENLPTIKAMEDTAFKQQLIPRRLAVDEVYFDPAKL
ncbi:MAG TPA: PhnD/SsuA/transferrin family substrate-binding protein [Caulobacteraceae bacterium]|nr:PhnD/SsuA/transferrin family substrate-binding protein [Caulobacteraceae bacterium]